MEQSTVWWLLAGVTVAIELTTGTFYLLMISVGLAAAAIAAHLGTPVTVQILTAAIAGGGAVAIWNWFRSKQPLGVQASANPDVHMDIGETVHVSQWHDDGTTHVKYRGANWTAVLANPSSAAPPTGQYTIQQMQGNRLVIEPSAST